MKSGYLRTTVLVQSVQRIASVTMSPRSRPLQYRHFHVSFPDKHVVQVTLDRQQKLNCIDKATSREIAQIWDWLDQDETLWVGIITGVGRAFCTGADLGGRVPPSTLSMFSTEQQLIHLVE